MIYSSHHFKPHFEYIVNSATTLRRHLDRSVEGFRRKSTNQFFSKPWRINPFRHSLRIIASSVFHAKASEFPHSACRSKHGYWDFCYIYGY